MRTPQVSAYGLHHKQLTTSSKQSTFGFSHKDYDVENLFTKLVLSNDRKEAIYQFITNLKADLGITQLSEMFDCFYMFAAATQSDSLINWAQPGKYDCTVVGAQIAFRVGRGWYQTTNASTSYINSNFNPFLDPNSKYGPGTQSILENVSGSWGLYVNNFGIFQQVDYWLMGAASSGNSAAIGSGSPAAFMLRSTNGFYRYGCYTTGIPGFNLNQFNSVVRNGEGGLFSCVKSTYQSCELYYNGDLVERRNDVSGNFNTTTIIRDSGPIIFGNLNVTSAGGTSVSLVSSASDLKLFSFAYFGSKDIKPDIINRRLNEYLYAINGQTFIRDNNINSFLA